MFRRALVGPKEGGKNFISFVHVNLCLSLAVGLLVFMAGIENGTSSKVNSITYSCTWCITLVNAFRTFKLHRYIAVFKLYYII